MTDLNKFEVLKRRLLLFDMLEIITLGFVEIIDWAEHVERTKEILRDWNNGNVISEEYRKFRRLFSVISEKYSIIIFLRETI